MTRLHVLGVGSLGTLVTHHIRRANPPLPITLLLRDPSKFPRETRVTREGVESISTNYDLAPSFPSSSESKSNQNQTDEPIESLLVTLKAPQTVSAIKPLVPRLKSNSVISLLQNGMGTYQALCSELFTDPETRPFFILGTTPHGVAPNDNSGKGGKGDVKHHTAVGQGHIKWGVCPDPRGSIDIEDWIWTTGTTTIPRKRSALGCTDLAGLKIPPNRTDLKQLRNTIQALISTTELDSTLLPVKEVDRAMLLKVAINATINSLTAILGRGDLPNGSLTAISPSGPALVDALVGEISTILLAHLDRTGSGGEGEEKELFEFGPLRKLIGDVISETGGNTSSMAVDVREKRGTEVEFINGYLVRLGDELGVPTVINGLICDMLRFISASQRES
ncbi:hypothetical protein IAT40_000293 [Kwoniella sp. CBS 6097]